MAFTPVKVNGRYFDFTSIRCAGLPLGFNEQAFTAHIRALNFSDSITPSRSRGVHGIALPRGRGDYDCTTSIEIVWDAWDGFTKALAKSNVNGYSDFDFDLTINYKTNGKISEVVWKETSFLGPSASHAQGNAGGLTVTLNMATRSILGNGVCSYALDLDQDISRLSSGSVIEEI